MVYILLQKRAYPGQKIQLEIQGLDQFNLSTYLIARVSDSRDDINSGAFSQTTDIEISGVVRPSALEPASRTMVSHLIWTIAIHVQT